MIEIINLHKCKDWGKAGDVCIDRTTRYGNPFYMRGDTPEERERVIRKFEDWIKTIPDFITPELMKAKRLGCWCAPKKCHGEVIRREIEIRRCLR